MNRIFNVIWSITREKWVVVSEKVKSNGGAPKSLLLSIALLCGMLAPVRPASAIDPGALPAGGQITGGAGSMGSSGSRMTVNQSSQQMIANWSSFNIGTDASVHFLQPNVSATALNRIADQNPSQILGSLSANGKIFLLNQSGIIFGKTARVDVGGLIASSLNMLDSDFLAAKYKFVSSGNSGKVLNQGSISVTPGGVVALIAPKVTNEGTITARSGSVALAAGNKVTVDFTGDGLITLTVDEGTLDALVENKGLVKADGGLVVMTAKAVDALLQSAVNNSGVVEANTFQQRGGRILLDAVGGMTTVSGTLDASSADGKGGQVVATGDRVLVKDGAHLTASGATGGGEVLVGGNWQGKDATIHQATGTIVESGALLEANATDTGNGGTVVAWSDVTNPLSVTRAYGTFEAKGGPNGGDGGLIETSGYWLDVAGIWVSASGRKGKNGLWLLDPWDVTIGPDPTISGTLYSDYFIPTSDSTILASRINSALDGGSNVTITTGADGSSAGSITVTEAITSSTNMTLTLDAYGSIVINAPISGNVNLIFNAETGFIRSNATGAISGSGDTTFNVKYYNGFETYLGAITGTRTLMKQGAGTLILGGANDYTGKTTISGGTLTIDGAGLLGNGSYAGEIVNNSALVINTTNAQTISGKISGTGMLTQSGAGILTLSGLNDYTGSTLIFSGKTMEVSSPSALGDSAGGNVSLYLGATLGLKGNILINKYLSFNNGGTLSSISGSNTWLGVIDVYGEGTIKADSGTLELSNTVKGGGMLTVSGSGNVTISGNIGVPYFNYSSLTKDDTGVLTLSGVNTYIGATTINNGTISVSGNSALGDVGLSSVTVAVDAMLELDHATVGNNLDLRGTLSSFSGDNIYNGSISLYESPTINADSGTKLTLNLAVDGSGDLSVSGPGTVVFKGEIGNNDFTLASFTGAAETNLEISGGLLETLGSQTFNGPTTFGNGGGTQLKTNNGDITTGTTGAVGGRVTSTAGLLTLNAGTGNITFENPLNDFSTVLVESAGNISLIDNNSLTLNGVLATGTVNVETLTGDLKVDGNIGNDTSQGGSIIDVILTADNGGVSGNGNISGNDGGATIFDIGADSTYGGKISGSGRTLTKEGNGMLTLTNTANSYTGDTTISAGKLILGASDVIPGASNVVVDGSGVLDIGIYDDTVSTVTVNDTGSITGETGTLRSSSFTIVCDKTTSISAILGDVSGDTPISGELTKSGTGKLTLSGANTYTGATTISGGTILVSSDTGLGAVGGGAVTVNTDAALKLENNVSINKSLDLYGTLSSVDGDNIYVGSITIYGSRTISSDNASHKLTLGSIDGGNSGLTIDGVGHTEVSGVLSGSGGLTKSGAGTLTLSGTNEYSGSTTISDGTLEISGSGQLGSGNYAADISNASLLIIKTSADQTLSGIISGSGTLTKDGAGKLTLSGVNTYDGNTVITTGMLEIVGSGQLGSGNYAADISNASSLIINTSADQVLSGIISGSGTLTKDGAGKLTLSGVNTYDGNTVISAGTLEIGGAGMLGGGSYLGTISNASSLIINTSTDQTLSGIISGSGTLTKDGAGKLTLSVDNTYTGVTTIKGGTLSIAADSGLGVATAPTLGQLVINDGTLETTGTDTTLSSNRGINLIGVGTFSTAGTNTLTCSGIIAGSGGLTKLGTGTLTLSIANTYAGPTTINAGILSNGADEVIADASAVTVGSGGKWDLANHNEKVGSIAGSGDINLGSGALTAGNSSNTTYYGVLSGTGGLTKVGAGTLTLSGPNTYSGNTVISAGTLEIGGAGMLGGGSYLGTISNSSSLIYNTSADQTLSGIISGSGTLTKRGIGTLTLSGANIMYDGVTTIEAGALRITNASALGSIAGGTIVILGAALELYSAIPLTIAEPLTLSGTGIAFGGALRNIAGANEYSGDITLDADSSINSDSGSGIFTLRAIYGPHNLSINSPDGVTLSGEVGNTANPLASLSTVSGTKLYLNGGSVTTIGTQTYHSSVTLGDDTTLTGDGI
ncbi:MAG: autotransporter-associated beta strand repeat-containing protein, partial [Chlorobium sp.]